MKKVDGYPRTIQLLLSHAKYGLDYYQREYKWERRQLEELLQDLEQKFLLSYEDGHDRTEVQGYERYFLGSIIVSERDGQRFLIDGQQRLTTLTLLLIYLNNLQKGRDERVTIDHLIYSEKFGKKSFNLDVEDRRDCLEALFTQQPFNTDGQIEAVQNLAARYADIAELFPEKLKSDALLYFIDWLTECVDLIEITTSSDDDAYAIFETMNDRGLRLSQTDMLKGYLLSKIKDADQRRKANEIFKAKVDELKKIGDDKNEDIYFFRDWLRAKYAKTMRDRKKDAEDQDFERIATAFHRWVNEQSFEMGLVASVDFYDFIVKEISRFVDLYMRAAKAAATFTSGLEFIYYNERNRFTLQYPLILAPIRLEDDDATVNRKMALVSGYLDIFVARRIVNSRTLAYSSIVYTMFNLIKEIRDLDIGPLSALLTKKVSEMEETFSGVDGFALRQQNRKSVHYLLARMTYHIEQQAVPGPSFVRYISRDEKKPFEVEHIWSDKYDRHKDEFPTKQEFADYRNRFGGLLLLPRGFNQAYGADSYEKKLPHYYGQNLLARSLSPQCYEKNPTFLKYVEDSGLPFVAHPQFKKTDLDARQSLYRHICEQVWSSTRFGQIAEGIYVVADAAPETNKITGQQPENLVTGGWRPKSTIYELYKRLSDERWHRRAELEKITAGKADLEDRLAKIRRRGKHRGLWALEEKDDRFRLQFVERADSAKA